MQKLLEAAAKVARLDKSARADKEKEAFEEQYIRAQTGLGASGAHDH